MTAPTIKLPGPDHPSRSRRPRRAWSSSRRPRRRRQPRRAHAAGGRVPAGAVRAARRRRHGAARTHGRTPRTARTRGDCAYYSVPAGGARTVNAVWTYEQPYDAVAAIRDHVAFYPTASIRSSSSPDSPVTGRHVFHCLRPNLFNTVIHTDSTDLPTARKHHVHPLHRHPRRPHHRRLAGIGRATALASPREARAWSSPAATRRPATRWPPN